MVKSHETGERFIELSSQDSIAIRAELTNLNFQRVKGVINEQQVELSKQAISIDLPEELDNIKLQQAALRLDFHNHINFPIQTHVLLNGIDSQNQAINLTIDAPIASSGENAEKLTTVILDQQNSQVLPFLNNFPTQIEFSGTAQIGDGVSPGSIDAADFVFVEYQLLAPFILQMEEMTIQPDTSDLTIKPENYSQATEGGNNSIDAELLNDLQESEMFLSIANRFPVGVSVKMYISEELSKLYSDPDLIIGPVEIQPGNFISSDGVTEETLTQTQVALSAQDMAVFKNKGNAPKQLFVAAEITLPGTEQTVIIHANDYIHISSTIRVNTLIHPN